MDDMMTLEQINDEIDWVVKNKICSRKFIIDLLSNYGIVLNEVESFSYFKSNSQNSITITGGGFRLSIVWDYGNTKYRIYFTEYYSIGIKDARS